MTNTIKEQPAAYTAVIRPVRAATPGASDHSTGGYTVTMLYHGVALGRDRDAFHARNMDEALGRAWRHTLAEQSLAPADALPELVIQWAPALYEDAEGEAYERMPDSA